MKKANTVKHDRKVKYFRYGGLAVQVTEVYAATAQRDAVHKIEVISRLGNKVIAAAGNHFPRAAKSLAPLPTKFREQLRKLQVEDDRRERLEAMGIEVAEKKVATPKASGWTDFRKPAVA